jgi:BirA family biotin operon repressor/biotin-[acetyl-CoA-carboxylase] ligase
MMDFSVQHFDSLDSTNQEVLRQASAGAKEGLVVVAKQQTQGKGRLGRTWQTVDDALALSILLRPDIQAADVPKFSLLAAIATYEALHMFTPKVGIKWPNDVLIEGKKVSGILTQMQASGSQSDQLGLAVVIGIGININMPPQGWDKDMRTPPTCLNAYSQQQVDRQAVLQAVLESVGTWYSTWQKHGFSPIYQAWEQAHVARQKQVSVFDGSTYIQGTAIGLATDGALRLLVNGQEQRIIAGDVSIMEAKS